MIATLIERIKNHNNHASDDITILCGDLLEEAKRCEDYYAIAFAHIYMADFHILQRNHISCIQHLDEGLTIAKKYQFSDLLLHGYNIGGIYYNSHFDELTSLQYCIDAYNLAKELGNLDEEMVILNNVATIFSQNNDNVEALNYLTRAYQALLAKKKESISRRDLMIILNLIQMYIMNNQLNKAEEIYQVYEQQIQTFEGNDITTQAIALCKLYLAQAHGDYESVQKYIENFIHNDFPKQYNRSMYFSFYSDIFEITLQNKDRQRGEVLLQQMGEICQENDLEQQLKLHLNWIEFAETYHIEDTLIHAYRQYYLLQKMTNKKVNKTKSESMKEKIILSRMIKEHDKIEQEKRILEAQVKVDGLTNLFNRSYFLELAQTLHNDEYVKTLGFILVDVDYFKEYNDYYGHYYGDILLKQIAHCLNENGDNCFFAARYGGDEFICLCTNTDEKAVHNYLTNVYHDLNQLKIEHRASKVSPHATISAGYSIFINDDTYSYDTAIMVTDAALYEAKRNGRNQFRQYSKTF